MSEKITRLLCPYCGSRNISYIQYGYPVFNDEFLEKPDRKEIVLRGCVFDETRGRWLCQNCKAEFGATHSVPVGINSPELVKAHKHSIYHYHEIKESSICGCFYCLHTFSPSEIKEWIDDIGDDKTALCPYCGIDSVIGDHSRYPVTDKNFLQAMQDRWFNTTVPFQEEPIDDEE